MLWNGLDLVHVARDRDKGRALVSKVMNSHVAFYGAKLLTINEPVIFSRNTAVD
jgi:hypothetical protein